MRLVFFFFGPKSRQRQYKAKKKKENQHRPIVIMNISITNLNKCLFFLRSFTVFTFYVEVCDLVQVKFPVWCYFLSIAALHFARRAECPQYHTRISRTALIITLFSHFSLLPPRLEFSLFRADTYPSPLWISSSIILALE